MFSTAGDRRKDTPIPLLVVPSSAAYKA